MADSTLNFMNLLIFNKLFIKLTDWRSTNLICPIRGKTSGLSENSDRNKNQLLAYNQIIIIIQPNWSQINVINLPESLPIHL